MTQSDLPGGEHSFNLRPRLDHYLDNTTQGMKVLRFFNLLEPGRAVLSVSKLLTWLTLFALLYVLIERPADLIGALGAVGAFVATLGNYAWRRYMQ